MKIGDFVIQNDQEEKRLNYTRKTYKVVRVSFMIKCVNLYQTCQVTNSFNFLWNFM